MFFSLSIIHVAMINIIRNIKILKENTLVYNMAPNIGITITLVKIALMTFINRFSASFSVLFIRRHLPTFCFLFRLIQIPLQGRYIFRLCGFYWHEYRLYWCLCLRYDTEFFVLYLILHHMLLCY